MSNAGRVRRAESRDVDALVMLRAEMFAAMGTPARHEWQPHARAWFAERVDDPDYGFFVVEHAGEVVACAVGAVRDAVPSPEVPQGRDVLISNVCTRAEHRGRGFGRQAFDAVMAWARDTGVGRAELMATDAGRRMYERAGFTVTDHPAMRAPLGAEESHPDR